MPDRLDSKMESADSPQPQNTKAACPSTPFIAVPRVIISPPPQESCEISHEILIEKGQSYLIYTPFDSKRVVIRQATSRLTPEVKDYDRLSVRDHVERDPAVIAAVNGSFFDDGRQQGIVNYGLRLFKEDVHFTPNGIVVEDGQILSPHWSERRLPSDGVFLCMEDGTVLIDYVINVKDKVALKDVAQGLEAYPVLLKNGAINPNISTFPGKDNRRSAIGVKADGSLSLIAFTQADATLADFAQFLKSRGFSDALNLDGGGSTSMHIEDSKPDNDLPSRDQDRVVNVVAILAPT